MGKSAEEEVGNFVTEAEGEEMMMGSFVTTLSGVESGDWVEVGEARSWVALSAELARFRRKAGRGKA